MTEKMNVAQFRALKKKKPSKYRNEKVVCDGIEFDSIKEKNRYIDLRLMEKAGDITDLELQPIFQIKIEGKKIAKYKADFRYRQDGGVVVEDVKSPATRKNRTYRMKKKLVEAQFGILILET